MVEIPLYSTNFDVSFLYYLIPEIEASIFSILLIILYPSLNYFAGIVKLNVVRIDGSDRSMYNE
jgi:hypothetical protein